MTDDIVVRLRRCGCCDSFEAADEIERLRARVAELEAERATVTLEEMPEDTK